jgi:DNA invertase Pin-like site-specific DNA recombinase
MKIGYARVSTKDQSLNLQKDALKKAGCRKIYSEQISGTKTDRANLDEMIEHIRQGDIIVVWKLDRLGRSLRDLINLISKFQDLGVEFKSLQDNIDTTTPTGKLTFHLFAALAEFERDIISERTKAGLESARARGRKGGRPKGLSKKATDKARLAESLYNEKNNSIQEICEYLSVSKPTLYRYLRSRDVEIGSDSIQRKLKP